MSHPQVTGPTMNATTDLARAYDSNRMMWIISAGATTVEAAVTNLGLTPSTLTRTDERPLWQERTDAPTMQTLLDRARRQRKDEQKGPQWTVIQAQANWTEQQRRNINGIIWLSHKLGTKATIIAYCNGSGTQTEKTSRQAELQTVAEELGWHIYEGNLKNTKVGGHVEANTHYFVLANNDLTTAWSNCTSMDDDEPEDMANILDVNDRIFEACKRYQARVQEDLKQVGSNYFAQVKGRINTECWNTILSPSELYYSFTVAQVTVKGSTHNVSLGTFSLRFNG
jgi:hypothetical protein